jgi:5-methyltetrahydropteroyltriglutamate--homocysteine methyltransferase
MTPSARAGLVLQRACPDLACEWALEPKQSTAEFRKVVAQRLEALDYATRDIPPDRLRMHLCWGNYEGPHHTDVPLAATARRRCAYAPGIVVDRK